MNWLRLTFYKLTWILKGDNQSGIPFPYAKIQTFDILTLSMTKRRTSCRTLILVPFLFVLCLAVILIPLVAFALPQRAEQAFGRPAPELSLRQQIYLSSILLIQANDITLPADPYGSPQPFQVQLGESANSVINRLHGNGLIVNAGAFRAYLQYSGLDNDTHRDRASITRSNPNPRSAQNPGGVEIGRSSSRPADYRTRYRSRYLFIRGQDAPEWVCVLIGFA